MMKFLLIPSIFVIGILGFDPLLQFTPCGLSATEWMNEGILNDDADIDTLTGSSPVATDGFNALCWDETENDFSDITYILYNIKDPENVTMIIWVYPKSPSSHYDWLLSVDDGLWDRSIIFNDDRYDNDPKGLCNGIAMGIGDTYVSDISKPADHEWTQIVAKFCGKSVGDKATAYKNGGILAGEQQEIDIIRVLESTLLQTALNGNPTFSDHNLHGCIGQITIIDRCLSDSEIHEAYCDGMQCPLNPESSPNITITSPSSSPSNSLCATLLINVPPPIIVPESITIIADIMYGYNLEWASIPHDDTLIMTDDTITVSPQIDTSYIASVTDSKRCEQVYSDVFTLNVVDVRCSSASSSSSSDDMIAILDGFIICKAKDIGKNKKAKCIKDADKIQKELNKGGIYGPCLDLCIDYSSSSSEDKQLLSAFKYEFEQKPKQNDYNYNYNNQDIYNDNDDDNIDNNDNNGINYNVKLGSSIYISILIILLIIGFGLYGACVAKNNKNAEPQKYIL